MLFLMEASALKFNKTVLFVVALACGVVVAEDSKILPPAPATMEPAKPKVEDGKQWWDITNFAGWKGYGAKDANGYVVVERWRSDDTGKEQTTVPTSDQVRQVYYGDPYGFTNWLNGVRAQYGLGAVGLDANLSAWAAVNNDHQNAYGMGHHVMGAARRQNSGMGASTTVFQMWMASPAHRAALLDPSISWIGIAASGAYWTFNAY